jgi:PAS domain-containing protein
MENHGLRLITREFVDPLIEREFRAFTAAANGSVIRFMATIYAIGCVPYFFVNAHFGWVELGITRIAVLWTAIGLFTLLIAMWPLLHSGGRASDWVVSGSEVAVLGLICAVGWTLNEPDRAINLVYFVCVALAAWVLPNRISFIFVVAGIGSAMYVTLLLMKPAMRAHPTILAVWVVGVVQVLGYWTRRRNESLERRAFAHFRLAEQQSAELADAVARRDAVADRFALLSDLLPDALIVLDKDGRIVRSNDQASVLLAHSSESLCGRPVGSLLGVSQIPSQHIITIPIRHASKETRMVEVTVTMLPPGLDDWRTLVLLHDVSNHQRTAADLRQMARTDPLTELLNRRGFEELAQRVLMRSVSEGCRRVCCLPI